tara:strand:- start:1176 stop:1994 length:819 start_codon:yes stop_codon:yes gene_type:complete
MEEEIAIVYMVAGLSSRFGGKIKQFAKVGPNGESLIEYSVGQAISAGFNKIIFVVGEKTQEPIKEVFGNSYKGIDVSYALQSFDASDRDRPWGTVDALCAAKGLVKRGFVVCNGDDIYGVETFRKLVEHVKQNSTGATIGYNLGEGLSDAGGVNRGIFEVDSDGFVKSITETFDITRENLELKGLSDESLCSMNIFALHPEVLDLLYEILLEFKSKHGADRKIECLLPVELGRMIGSGKLRIVVYPGVEKWVGVTNPEDEVVVRAAVKEIYG